LVNPATGKVSEGLVYIVMEFMEGGELYGLVEDLGALGEDAGRFFLRQLLDCVEYMHSQRVVHRDLKLENILKDENLNLKLCDFGFATDKNINALSAFRGSKSYSAPEINEGKLYDGMHVDMFALGVILFIIVKGNLPFA